MYVKNFWNSPFVSSLEVHLFSSQVTAKGRVENKGWILESVDYKDGLVPEEIRIRGFRINKVEHLEKTYDGPGKFCFEA